MEKSFSQIVDKRCSVRGYCSRTVEKDKIDYVLECGRMAPSAVNRQPWKIYVAGPETDKDIWEKIWKSYDRDWFRQAPYVLICTILHDQSWKRGFDGKNHGDIDIAILTEHLCLAAAEQGLGTCWVCNFDAESLKEDLNIQDNEEPAVLLPLGYPSDDFVPRTRTRKEISEIVVSV